MRKVLLIAAALVASFSMPARATDWKEINLVAQRILDLGVSIQWMNINTGICARRGLQGLYVRPKRAVVICRQTIRDHNNRMIDTLKHEGWHAVQHLCTDSEPVKSKTFVASYLTDTDKFNLGEFYSRDMRPLEAEARAMEKLPVYAYLYNIKRYCPS
jgi:hypothetical protein